MNKRALTVINYALDRMGELSTWQGFGFVLGLCGAKWAVGLDWGGAAALGGTISAGIKVAFPDKLKE